MRRIFAWVTLIACGVAACGGETGDSASGSGGSGGSGGGVPEAACGEHPRACMVGETCWFAAGGKFTCQPSGAGKTGEACTPVVGEPTCGDGLLCIKLSGDDGGACTPLCDPSSLDTMCGELLCVPVQTTDGDGTHVCN